MSKKQSALAPFKKPLILLGGFLLLVLVFGKIVPAIRNVKSSTSPIVGIQASCEKSYQNTETLNLDDFEIMAIHENGDQSTLSAEEVQLVDDTVAMTGKYTEAEIVLTANEEISCTVQVPNERKEIVSFECGNPVISDVKAVLYSNGELCFEGEGDILRFDDRDYPWMNYDGDDDNPIRSISFEDTVTPANMDGFFEDIESLEYIANIPFSVESLSYTFSGCESLTHIPDLDQCENLLDMSETFADCISLKEIPSIPPSVVNTSEMCYRCQELQTAPDMAKATGLQDATAMFQECKKLTKTNMPPNVKIIDKMYYACINLKSMPEIPESVISMDSTFQDDVNLSKLTIIPKNVTNVSNCLSGCGKIKGLLWIDGNPEKYSNFLNDSAIATKVDLQGNSKMLDILANTADDNINITVNGKEPNKDVRYSDIVILD